MTTGPVAARSRTAHIGRSSLGAVLGLALLLSPAARAATDPSGLWLTKDRGGVIEVSHCGRHLCARIVGIVLDKPTDPIPVDYAGATQCGLVLINDATEVSPNLWRGHIHDPRNGSIWSVQLWDNPDGTFSLRGFLGFSRLGHTEIWTRYKGEVPTDCRLSPADVGRPTPANR
jgi:uncharacterized protein (DUF2147 family)